MGMHLPSKQYLLVSVNSNYMATCFDRNLGYLQAGALQKLTLTIAVSFCGYTEISNTRKLYVEFKTVALCNVIINFQNIARIKTVVNSYLLFPRRIVCVSIPFSPPMIPVWLCGM
jgi:hypothetical protein